jgi:glycosyltransferase involved in cell wall biosynthesis
MRNPKVSIGLPVFNGERYLRQALDSLLGQYFQDFELIISDNASTDRTAEICRAFAANDRRIRYYRNESNIGSAPNYRRVFELARGEFFKWCSYDDLCHKCFLSRCLKIYESAPPSVVLVYPRCEIIGEFGEFLGRASDYVETKEKSPHRRLAHVLRNVSYAFPIWGLIRTHILRSTSLTGSVAYWDDILLAELSLLGEIWEIPDVLSQQRSHQGNAVAIYSAQQGGDVANRPNKANRRTRQALLAWTDPRKANKRFWLPIHEERYWEYMKRIRRARLSSFEKLLCYLTVPRVCYWRRLRTFGGYWKRRLTQGTAYRAGVPEH